MITRDARLRIVTDCVGLHALAYSVHLHCNESWRGASLVTHAASRGVYPRGKQSPTFLNVGGLTDWSFQLICCAWIVRGWREKWSVLHCVGCAGWGFSHPIHRGGIRRPWRQVKARLYYARIRTPVRSVNGHSRYAFFPAFDVTTLQRKRTGT